RFPVLGSYNGDAEDHPGHPGRVVRQCVMRAVRRRLPAETQPGRYVRGDVAVEQPVAGALRRPRHRHRSAGRKKLGDDAWLQAVRERRVLRAIAETLDLEEETVKMHGMRLRAEVEHAPPNVLAEPVRQPLGRWP